LNSQATYQRPAAEGSSHLRQTSMNYTNTVPGCDIVNDQHIVEESVLQFDKIELLVRHTIRSRDSISDNNHQMVPVKFARLQRRTVYRLYTEVGVGSSWSTINYYNRPSVYMVKIIKYGRKFNSS
jgi:hypothetical protein